MVEAARPVTSYMGVEKARYSSLTSYTRGVFLKKLRRARKVYTVLSGEFTQQVDPTATMQFQFHKRIIQQMDSNLLKVKDSSKASKLLKDTFWNAWINPFFEIYNRATTQNRTRLGLEEPSQQ